MSPPRCGLMTVVVPLRMWSPVNSARSSSRKKHRWFGAWPGVCNASSRNSVPSIVSPSASTRSRSSFTSSAFGNFPNAPTSAPVFLRIRVRRGPVVGMGVREQDPAHAVAHRRADDRLDVLGDIGTGIDHRDLVDADEIRVRARTGHEARIVRQPRAGSAATARSAPPGVIAGTRSSPRAVRSRRDEDVGERDRPVHRRATDVVREHDPLAGPVAHDFGSSVLVARHRVEIGEQLA